MMHFQFSLEIWLRWHWTCICTAQSFFHELVSMTQCPSVSCDAKQVQCKRLFLAFHSSCHRRQWGE
jgi:hypothetical protein